MTKDEFRNYSRIVIGEMSTTAQEYRNLKINTDFRALNNLKPILSVFNNIPQKIFDKLIFKEDNAINNKAYYFAPGGPGVKRYIIGTAVRSGIEVRFWVAIDEGVYDIIPGFLKSLRRELRLKERDSYVDFDDTEIVEYLKTNLPNAIAEYHTLYFNLYRRYNIFQAHARDDMERLEKYKRDYESVYGPVQVGDKVGYIDSKDRYRVCIVKKILSEFKYDLEDIYKHTIIRYVYVSDTIRLTDLYDGTVLPAELEFRNFKIIYNHYRY